MADDNPARGPNIGLHLVVLRCQTGDEQAFGRLLNEFGPRTLAHLRSLIGDDAEDVQQEVWLTVYRNIASLANPGAFRTWLFATTRHRAIDFLRRRKREREVLEEVTVMGTPMADDPDPFEPEPIDATQLNAAVADLPPLQREVVVLRYRDKLSYSEIAVVVGCPVGTVRTRLHHAKRRLQERLERGTT